MEYKTVTSIESDSQSRWFGIKIDVAMGRELTEEEKSACYQARRLIQEAVEKASAELNPETKIKAQKTKENLIACFPQPIYAKEIPNEYWNKDPTALTSPWLMVTTAIGHFKIGWRKRVINIDWSETDCKKTGKALFPDYQMTVGADYIHAYNYDDARTFIAKIFESMVPPKADPSDYDFGFRDHGNGFYRWWANGWGSDMFDVIGKEELMRKQMEAFALGKTVKKFMLGDD